MRRIKIRVGKRDQDMDERKQTVKESMQKSKKSRRERPGGKWEGKHEAAQGKNSKNKPLTAAP